MWIHSQMKKKLYDPLATKINKYPLQLGMMEKGGKVRENSFHCVDCSQGRRKQSDNLWENIKKRKSMTNN